MRISEMFSKYMSPKRRLVHSSIDLQQEIASAPLITYNNIKLQAK